VDDDNNDNDNNNIGTALFCKRKYRVAYVRVQDGQVEIRCAGAEARSSFILAACAMSTEAGVATDAVYCYCCCLR
jgi:hypothetical protein